MKNLTIRPFRFDKADYLAKQELDKLVWPEKEHNLEFTKLDDKKIKPDVYWKRYVGEVDGQFVAIMQFSEAHWVETTDQYDIYTHVHPEFRNRGYGNQLFDFGHKQIVNDGHPIKKLTAGTQADQPYAIHSLEKRGFECKNVYEQSEVDVKAFDPTPFAELDGKLAANGIVIKSFAELSESDPGCIQKIWDLNWIFKLDEPTPDKPKKKTLEEWVERNIKSPWFNPDALFVAVDGDTYAGYSQMWMFTKDNPKIIHQGWTGTNRGYRRKGVATALKLAGFEYAKQIGAEKIRTENHDTNAMYQINLKLGFRPMPAWLSYEKTLIAGEQHADS